MIAVQIILLCVFAYAAVGLVFAAVFACVGITRVDAASKGSSVGFRLLMIPGAAALWPVLLRQWRAGLREEASHDAN